MAEALCIIAVPCQLDDVQYFCQTMESQQEKTSYGQREEKGNESEEVKDADLGSQEENMKEDISNPNEK